MKIKVWLSIIFITCVVTGCSFFSQSDSDSEMKNETLGLTPDFSYTVVQQVPNILVNQVGYLVDDSKVAILHGKDLETEFVIYNALTHEEEYKGILKAGKIEISDSLNEATGLTEKKDIYLADFSKVTKEGTYYIYHPNLGYSYEFVIGTNIYNEVETKMLQMIEKEENDTSLMCYQLTALLLTKELYPNQILDTEYLDRLCKEKIERLLQSQDSGSGAIYADISTVEKIKDLDQTQKQQYISLAATAEFAGTMAIYAYQMRDLDWNMYHQCYGAAERAYRTIQNSLDNVAYDAGYFAAAHLYRLTGRGKYSQAVNQYLGMKEEQKSYTEYDFSLYADYAYITFRYGVNLETSEKVMKRLMSEAEEISLSSGRPTYYVSEQKEYNDIDGKLQDMGNLALVNYIITNHEYTQLQKNYRDYFMGRNPQNICYIDGFGVLNSMEETKKVTPKNCGLFYLLLQSTKR
ncbi:MAG: glycoside hydrolase family 9 protein [Lachnospiraceae bacterium]|nr:glycoside hydrolase family 9 protein [Lachnospiraceae bacterium]